ncbi:MAG: hypothetical protein KGL39_29770 [Patescibacteria group bacterium]|nr:hypothetical protein [Patescibacteria group bacterium]
MTRYTLHIPEQYNDGAPVAPEYFATVEQAVEDIAGGWTLTHGIGGWRGEDSRYREPVRLYHVDTDSAPDPLLDLADDIAAALGQEAVYLTAQDISTTLVTSRQEVAA